MSKIAGYWILTAACACGLPASPATAADEVATAAAAKPRAAPQHRDAGLDERVKLLAAELDLDAQLQLEVRRILEDQRTQIEKVWSNTALPAASRVSATRAISDRTGDQIRALLNDEQKAKFTPPRRPRDPEASATAPTVQDWMNAAAHSK